MLAFDGVPTTRDELARMLRDRYARDHRCRTLLYGADPSPATGRMREILDERCLAWVDASTVLEAVRNDAGADELWLLVEHFTRRAHAAEAGEGASVYTTAASLIAVYLTFATSG